MGLLRNLCGITEMLLHKATHYKTDLFKSLFKDQKLSQLLLTLVAACMQMSEKTRQDAV